MCCEALEWSCPSCWNKGSSLSKTIDFGPVVNSSSPEKIYNALDIINKTRKKESAISLPRMVNASLLSVLTLCDDDLD